MTAVRPPRAHLVADQLLSLLGEQAAVMERLRSAIGDQAGLADRRRFDDLRRLTARREQLVAQWAEIAGRIERLDRAHETLAAEIDAEQADRLREAARRVAKLRSEILDMDAALQSTLTQRRTAVAGELLGARRSVQAHRAYQACSDLAGINTDRKG